VIRATFQRGRCGHQGALIDTALLYGVFGLIGALASWRIAFGRFSIAPSRLPQQG
jgi:hypothetical protein